MDLIYNSELVLCRDQILDDKIAGCDSQQSQQYHNRHNQVPDSRSPFNLNLLKTGLAPLVMLSLI